MGGRKRKYSTLRFLPIYEDIKHYLNVGCDRLTMHMTNLRTNNKNIKEIYLRNLMEIKCNTKH